MCHPVVFDITIQPDFAREKIINYYNIIQRYISVSRFLMYVPNTIQIVIRQDVLYQKPSWECTQ